MEIIIPPKELRTFCISFSHDSLEIKVTIISLNYVVIKSPLVTFMSEGRMDIFPYILISIHNCFLF